MWPRRWQRLVRLNRAVLIFKNKGDLQSCGSYRRIKLMSHTMKLWGRVVEARLRTEVSICEQQYGFIPKAAKRGAIVLYEEVWSSRSMLEWCRTRMRAARQW